MQEAAPRSNYIKSLDGMRGLGAFAIMTAHWPLLFPKFPFAWEFLQMFFVLSGFLITRILLYEKKKFSNFKGYYRKFFLRRVYRIFPLYFGYLFLLLLIRVLCKEIDFIQDITQEGVDKAAFLFTYLYNFSGFFLKEGISESHGISVFSHLWSLSFEEQFYIFFPFFVFFLSNRDLKMLIIALIIGPQLLRFFAFPILEGINDNKDWIGRIMFRNTFFQFDSIAYGAAIAAFDLKKIKHPKRWFYICLAIFLAVYGINTYLATTQGVYVSDAFGKDPVLKKVSLKFWIKNSGYPEYLIQFGRHHYNLLLVNIMFFFMVLSSVRGTPVFIKLLESKFAVYLGKISYSFYVLHPFVMVAFFMSLNVLISPKVYKGKIVFQFGLYLLFTAILIGVSHLVYKYFESFFLKLKDKVR